MGDSFCQTLNSKRRQCTKSGFGGAERQERTGTARKQPVMHDVLLLGSMIKINRPHLTTASQHVHSGMLSATLLGEPLLAAAQRTLQNTKSTAHTNPNTWAHTQSSTVQTQYRTQRRVRASPRQLCFENLPFNMKLADPLVGSSRQCNDFFTISGRAEEPC